MIRWECPPRCLVPHALPVRSHHESLTWHPVPGDEQVRIVRWTCDCDPVLYELCQSDERRFVRRTTRARNAPSIHESDRHPAAEADALWIALLHGLAR